MVLIWVTQPTSQTIEVSVTQLAFKFTRLYILNVNLMGKRLSNVESGQLARINLLLLPYIYHVER